jgi:tRNA threonylcarbamoyladenosine biosynthesis protein TsaE
MEFNIESEKELKNVAEEIQTSLFMKMALEHRTGKEYGAIVIGLFGDLGSGKTTFTKYFAKQFGIKKTEIISPTFVLQKRFDISKVDEPAKNKKTKTKKIKHPFKNFYHLDVYRIEDSKEIESIGWNEITADPQNIILVEWADKISDILPTETIKIYFKNTGENSRNIKIEIN